MDIKKPEGKSDEDWLEDEIEAFEDRVDDMLTFRKKYIKFFTQVVETAEFKELKIMVQSLEDKLNSSGKDDFVIAILSMLFSTIFTTLIKVLGERWVKNLSSVVASNHVKYKLTIADVAYTATANSPDKVWKTYLEDVSKTSFSSFIQLSKDEVVRHAKGLFKKEKVKAVDFFDMQKTLMHNESIRFEDFQLSKIRWKRKVKRDVREMKDVPVVEKIQFLRDILVGTIEDTSDFQDVEFRRFAEGIFIGYGVALARHVVRKDVLIFPWDEEYEIPGALDLSDKKHPFGYRVGDIHSISLINATHALRLAGRIPALENVGVGCREREGHPLVMVKKGTYLAAYFTLDDTQLMWMLLDEKHPFTQWFNQNWQYWHHNFVLGDFMEVVENYVANYLVQSAGLPTPTDKEQDERAEEVFSIVREVFTEKYLPDVAEHLIQPILLQYVNDYKTKREKFTNLKEVKEAFKEAKANQ